LGGIKLGNIQMGSPPEAQASPIGCRATPRRADPPKPWAEAEIPSSGTSFKEANTFWVFRRICG
jgi:hypothetical protein